jgi:hypothetical protein
MSHEETMRDRIEKLYNFSNFHTLYPFLNKLAVVVLADFLMIRKSDDIPGLKTIETPKSIA